SAAGEGNLFKGQGKRASHTGKGSPWFTLEEEPGQLLFGCLLPWPENQPARCIFHPAAVGGAEALIGGNRRRFDALAGSLFLFLLRLAEFLQGEVVVARVTQGELRQVLEADQFVDHPRKTDSRLGKIKP